MANGIIIAYQLEYDPAGGNQRFTSSQNFTALSGTVTVLVTGLFPSTEYEFRVAAFTRVGCGPYPTIVRSFTTSKFLPYFACYILTYIH